LEGVLEDAEVDCKQLEDDLKAMEKERDALELRLAEKVKHASFIRCSSILAQ
jgi:hypothetical protein